MNEGLQRPNDDGFDSTVFARPRPTSAVSLPGIFDSFFGPATRTTLPSTSIVRATPSPTSRPTPTPKAPATTTEAPTTLKAPPTSKQSESSAEESSSKEESSTPTSSSKSTQVIVEILSTANTTPSTFETITSSSSASLVELQPTVSSLSTLEPFEPIASSSSFSSSIRSTTVPPPASHTGAASSQPNTEGGERSSRTSGGTIGGIVGGISGAILVAILLFFCWRWRTRGRYRFKKRSSFDPYGNGIDANQGGLLVSSVACKPSDQSSGKETLYSDEHSPTRYQHVEPQSEAVREPTIPIMKEPKPRTYSNSPPANRPPREQMREPFPPFVPEMSMNGAVQQPMRSYQSQPRPYPLLYERRRPPVPPSMRRNRSPMERNYGDYPPRHHPALNEPIPGIYAIEPSGLGFAGPYPQNTNMLRSNSIGAQRPLRGPLSVAQMDRNRRVRRSNSMNNLNHRGFAPHNLYYAIPEGPLGMNRGPGTYHRPSRSTPPPQDPRAHAFYDQPQSHQIRRNLTVRNPTPAYSGAEKLSQPARKPLSDMVRRATLKHKNDDDDEQPRQKPKHAAKNF